MTKTVQDLIQEHNDSINNYINGELATKLNAKDGKIKISQWFETQKLIKEQGFYEKGRTLQDTLRLQGYDVKMNMQTHELILYK